MSDKAEERKAWLEKAGILTEALGDAVVDHYLHFARSELAACEAQVSDIERQRYFERI